MAKMLFRPPKAARVIDNPSPEEVKELAAKMLPCLGDPRRSRLRWELGRLRDVRRPRPARSARRLLSQDQRQSIADQPSQLQVLF